MKPKITLVTGGAIRLGAAICDALAEKGANLAIHYRHHREEAEEIAVQCRRKGVFAETIAGDFSTVSGVETFLEEYQSRFPDTLNLINNVGNYAVASALETSVEVWQELFQVNFLAAMMLIQRLAPGLMKNKGRVVNLGVAGLKTHRASTYMPAYKALKGALLAMTQSFAKELAPLQVTVNMVSPGMLDIAVDAPSDPSKLTMGRLASCDEVARVVAFLLEPSSGYITGQNIEVAGGVGL